MRSFPLPSSPLLLVAGLLLAGCSGGSFEVAEGDGAVNDTGALDSSTLDSTTPEGGGEDTGDTDSTVVDTGAIDGGGVDSGAVDSARPDSGKDSAVETGVDGGKPDTGIIVVDSALDEGVISDAIVCPRPPSTASYDPSTLDCPALQSKFPAYLDEARNCTCDADCNETIDNLCGCPVWVSPSNDAFVGASRMREKWKTLGCVINCPAIPCVMTSGKTCVKNGGVVGRCQ